MRQTKKGTVLLFFLLMIFWVILSGKTDPLSITLGVLACLVVVFYGRDMLFEDGELPFWRLNALWRWPLAFLTLIVAMVKANFQVARIVMSRKMPLSPEFRKVRQPVKRDMTRALYGNAITLTPGTLSVDVTSEYLLVHCLTEEAADAIENGPLEKAFTRLEENR